jgi:hypothetical protein
MRHLKALPIWLSLCWLGPTPASATNPIEIRKLETPAAPLVNSVAMDASTTVMFALAGESLWRSGNEGRSWKRVDTRFAKDSLVAVAISGNHAYLSTFSRVYESDLSAKHWTEVYFARNQIALAADDSSVFTLQDKSEGQGVVVHKLFRSKDWLDLTERHRGRFAGPLSLSSTGLFIYRPLPAYDFQCPGARSWHS